VRKFFRGRGNFRFNRVKHGGGEYRSRKPEARRDYPRISRIGAKKAEIQFVKIRGGGMVWNAGHRPGSKRIRLQLAETVLGAPFGDKLCRYQIRAIGG
jgi:hypothetical protein